MQGISPLQAHFPLESGECRAGRHVFQSEADCHFPRGGFHDGQHHEYIVFLEAGR